MKKLLLTSFLFALVCGADAQVIVTAAGKGVAGYSGDGHLATNAELRGPYGVALDDSGNLYICDVINGCVRKVSPAYGGIITTIAGNGTPGYSGDGGWGFLAQLGAAYGVAVDHRGNVYIADAGNDCIRKVTPSDTITTIAGRGTAGYNGDGIPATAAFLSGPYGVAVDGIGNIYITDAANYRIRKIDNAGSITTIAGTGVPGYTGDGGRADTAQIYNSGPIEIDRTGNIYFGDSMRVRKIDTAGFITTVAGNGIWGFSGDSGTATAAELEPEAIAMDTAGNLFIADGFSGRIRKINTLGIISTVAGDGAGWPLEDGGSPLLAGLGAMGVAVSNNGDIYIGDVSNNRVRMVTTRALQTTSFVNSLCGLNVYPNPCQNYCTLNVIASTNEQVDVIISDIIGRKIVELKMRTNEPVIISTRWPPGVYTVNAITTLLQYYDKIIVR